MPTVMMVTSLGSIVASVIVGALVRRPTPARIPVRVRPGRRPASRH